VITILLADDHPVVRHGLRGMLEAEPDLRVVGEAGTGTESITLATNLRPEVVLMDLRMPDLDGASATTQIRAAVPDTRVMILTTYDTDRDILRAIEAGACGYLLKDATPQELADAVRAAVRGQTVLTDSAARTLTRPSITLSTRETQVIRLVAQGFTNATIGQNLYISEATVKTHLLRIFAKLDVTDRTAAVATAMSRQLI
jgi:DNA-binding NarL/FixJ family response regulator